MKMQACAPAALPGFGNKKEGGAIWKAAGAAGVSRLDAWARPLPRIKHPPMLQNRIPVRHPRDVIRDRPGAAGGALGGFGVQRQVAVFGGHETYVFEECHEERFQDAAGLGRHAEHLLVLVDALTEELHELGM